jgi:hypothetical protein
MPTGYTACIGEGADFNKFALGCTRAFGALIMMRDEPGDAPIPERFEPSDYHAKAIKVAEASLRELDGMPLDEAERRANADYAQAMQRNREMIAKNDALRESYTAMLAKVAAWQAPTADHEGLKTFMREQITQSIDFDCSNEYYLRNAPVKLTAMEWRSKQVEAARRDITYHSKEHADEVGRAATRTDWVKALRESLP